jgi:hypothetical protein
VATDHSRIPDYRTIPSGLQEYILTDLAKTLFHLRIGTSYKRWISVKGVFFSGQGKHAFKKRHRKGSQHADGHGKNKENTSF